MKIGAVFPQTEIGNDPIAIRDYAQAVEQLGFDHILVFDHVLGAHPDRFEGRFRPPVGDIGADDHAARPRVTHLPPGLRFHP